MISPNNHKILLVEDNEADVILFEEYLLEGGLSYEITHIEDGEKAIKYFGTLNGSGTEFPDVVVLDLNLPRKRGDEVLAYIQSKEHLKSLPVLVYSTSQDPREIKKCYSLGAGRNIMSKLTDLQDSHKLTEALRHLVQTR